MRPFCCTNSLASHRKVLFVVYMCYTHSDLPFDMMFAMFHSKLLKMALLHSAKWYVFVVQGHWPLKGGWQVPSRGPPVRHSLQMSTKLREQTLLPALDVFGMGWIIKRPSQGAAEMLPKMTHDPI